VYNRFYDTDEYFPWTPISGTWQIGYPWTPISGAWKLVEDGEGALGYELEPGIKEVYAAHNEGNHAAWFSFKRVSPMDSQLDKFRIRLRHIDANNYLDVQWRYDGFHLNLSVEECVNGVKAIKSVLQYVGGAQDVWYDVYVQLEGTSVVVYAGKRGQEMVKAVDATTSVPAETDGIKIIVEGATTFYFDNLKVMKRKLTDRTMAFTYGPGNQLKHIERGDGSVVDMEYDAWGRVVKATQTVLGNIVYTAELTYEYGDKLKRVVTDFPELDAGVVEYAYDGLGKRRNKLSSVDGLTCWRWDAGYSVLTEYVDETGQSQAAPEFTRFFVPKGHTAFAEAEMNGTDPATADYIGSSLPIKTVYPT